MSTLRSRATSDSKRGFFGRLFAPSSARAVRRVLSRVKAGHPAPFEPLDGLPADKRALAFRAAAEALQANGDDGAAFDALGRALTLDFTSTSACLAYAELAVAHQRYPEGISACRRLLAQTPGQVPVVAALARLLVCADDPTSALGVIAEAGYDDLPLLALREGQALHAAGEREAAVERLDWVIEVWAEQVAGAPLKGQASLDALLAEAREARARTNVRG